MSAKPFSSFSILNWAPIIGAFFLFSADCLSQQDDQKRDVSEVYRKPERADGDIRFLSYNLKNYLTMRRGDKESGKPEKEISALVALIARHDPDIIGVSEIGSEEDLLDLQKRLKNAGVDLPEFEHTGGWDRVRKLGLLSRFPIIERNSPGALTFDLEGRPWTINRGVLDVTIKAGGMELRFLGVHFKSKREIEEASQELIRQGEAALVKEYSSEILAKAPDTKLFVYGDFNDTIMSPTLSRMRGRSNSKTHLADFYFKDSRGMLWTHFWNYQDTYARIDYVCISKAASPYLVGKESYIIDDPRWFEASDHRALLLTINNDKNR